MGKKIAELFNSYEVTLIMKADAKEIEDWEACNKYRKQGYEIILELVELGIPMSLEKIARDYLRFQA